MPKHKNDSSSLPKDEIVKTLETTDKDRNIKNDSDIMSEDEVLKTMIKVSKRTLKNWRDAGIIPYIKVRRRVFYHRGNIVQALLRLEK